MVVNENGDVKCYTKDGQIRWIPMPVASNKQRLKDVGLVLADAPKKIEVNIPKEIAEDTQAKRVVKTKKPTI